MLARLGLSLGVRSRPAFVVLNTPVRSVSLLAKLHPSVGSFKNDRRVGRGPASGRGKTSTRGQKGQKARGNVKPWFEGGQTPIHKLFPKRGFYRHNKREYNEVKLLRIAEYYRSGLLKLEDGEVLTMRKMKQCGLVSGPMKDGVAILGNGKAEYDLPISIEASKASFAAIRAIERAGGKFVAKFFSTSLGYRAHHAPRWFVRERGYLPIQAKPIARRDILFYSDEARRGYMSDVEPPKITRKRSQKKDGSGDQSKGAPVLTALESQLQSTLSNDASKGSADAFLSNKVLSFSDLSK
ncbi:unnamed protein product [Kuraishia capsulata CBS 1993]|uniref:Large ribosomal subunit protein uL15/eL18 domain-containing protein n=1 Tax=Kuraishia capsulata CBS 1993 TaxID=1382522 RepID=W6MX22_9ASCO|nr:uncharacterized protein KUCA_T00004121001 [Kuraishia capsulata CBS 1993]CDK28140.1 unnamed protein product [Kuraishia capsulata CBS 1993]